MSTNTLFAILALILAAIAAIYLIGVRKGKNKQLLNNVSDASQADLESEDKL